MLIILYTIFKINQVNLYNLTEFKKIQNFVEISDDLIYNITNVFKMGEFVVSPILMILADDSIEFTATVVISGISIVVGVLFLLIGIFQAFGKIAPKIEAASRKVDEKFAALKQQLKEKRAAKKAAKAAESGDSIDLAADNQITDVPIPRVPAPAPVVQPGISGEVVAAISAAIAATEGSGAVIRSIKKKNVGGRNPWAQAAVNDNTRPF